MKKTSMMMAAFALAAGAALWNAPDMEQQATKETPAAGLSPRGGEAGWGAGFVRGGQQGDVASLIPTCRAANGRKVHFRAVSAATLAKREAVLGVATLTWLGKPIIYYDAPTLSRAPSAMAGFVLYHECAHHELGHTLTKKWARSRETDTDCRALQRLVAEKRYGRFELKVIMDYFNKHLGNTPPSTYYPPVGERMKKLDACYRAIPG